MKITIPEISWHNRDPVFSLDIQPNPQDGTYRMATSGSDTHVVVGDGTSCLTLYPHLAGILLSYILIIV